ncbi:glycosyltransferase family 25 protein [Acinetobacter sp. UBA801]|uniref:glycosyltransferase family 25 protein n=1 Tax=Acinetobacter sp. UBA801 TaxID=1945958 RepID=UPI0025C73AFD|nr:glycosyltransferase family 25 protein [Acinetobacter sp. UBA801]
MISLERDYIRRNELKCRFPINYPLFSWIKAVDATQEMIKEFDSKFGCNSKYRNKKPLTFGEMCCAVSHLLALEDFVKSDSNYCCIIEDDIIGSDKDFEMVLKNVEKFPLNSSVWILGGQQGMKNARYLSGYRLASNLWKIPKESMYFLTRACCYVINQEAAKKIIESQKNLLRRSDIWEYYSTLGINFFYSNIFEHPIDLKNSRLEYDRKDNNTLISKIMTDGILNLVYRNILKIYIKLLRFFSKLDKVPIKNN